MEKGKKAKSTELLKDKILYCAAKSFLTNGFTDTTLRGLARDANTNYGSIQNLFKTKDDLLCELVKYVLEGQFRATEKFLQDKTDDKILFYAAETTLQLHMAESNEHIRDLYAAAYSLPKSSAIIQKTITGKLENIFSEHLPDLKTQDFYKLEIASGGIMRGFLTIPCDMWFTMDQKVASFLETTFLVYRVPDEKIKEAIEFVSQFDYPSLAQMTIDGMYKFLEDKTK